MSSFDWSKEKVERLRELKAAGTAFSAIAIELGCTRNAAIGRAHRLGLGMPRPNNVGDAPPRQKLAKQPQIRKKVQRPPKPVSKGEIALLDLESHHCRYFCDNDLFCGRPKIEKAYCAFHAGICYEKSS